MAPIGRLQVFPVPRVYPIPSGIPTFSESTRNEDRGLKQGIRPMGIAKSAFM